MLRQTLIRLGALFAVIFALAMTTMSASAQVANMSVTEGDSGTQSPQIVVTGPFDPGDSVSYSFSAGSATAGVDYDATAGQLVCPQAGGGCASMFIQSIVIHGDNDIENDETFTVNVSGHGSATITILNDDFPDTIPPVISVPGSITIEASSPSGAVVTFSVSATDNEDGSVTPVCDYQSGATFPVGTTTVNCSATDAADNTGFGSFNIVVLTAAPPTLSLPADITVDATGPAGAVVTFNVTATDDVDGPVIPVCDYQSGATFPVGTTTVSCTATDNAGNTSEGSFFVTVQDITPPTLSLPADITVDATGPNGAAVTFSVSATDDADGPVTPVCDYQSGATFPVGTTTVSCTATDNAGNISSGSFTVTVLYQAGGDGGSISIGGDNDQDNDNDNGQDADQSGGDATNDNDNDQDNDNSIDADGANGGDGGNGETDTDVDDVDEGGSVNVGGDQGITAALIVTLIALLMSLLP